MDISKLDDETLWRRTEELADSERDAIVDLVEYMAEVDDRRLWEKKGYSTMFEYCVCKLRLSEAEAFWRIRAARAIRLFAPISELMRAGKLSLTAVAILHPYLRDADAAVLVSKAQGMRRRELELLLADRRQPEIAPDLIRFGAPEETPSVPSEPPSLLPPESPVVEAAGSIEPAEPRDSAAPVQPERLRTVRIAFSADESFYSMLRRAQQLMRHKYPNGSLRGVLGDALKLLIEKKDLGLRWMAREKRRTARLRARAGGG